LALDFSSQKQKAEQQFREELRILATQIETINQQLAGGGANGQGGGPANTKAYADLGAKLNFIYEFLKSMQNDLRQDNRASFEEVGKQVSGTIQKNLGDIYAAQQDIATSIKAIQEKGVTANSGGANGEDITDIKSTLRELISVYKEEVTIFKAQNEFLQKKLVDIEKRLGELERD
jgi:hypothetical protein